jgi:hypothetical protein
MPLAAGERIGPYEVLALIGAGGMGEVYRARDTKLKRDVALKVLPDAFASDPERMARFQREAEVLASLNHPNIAHIYGVEDRALVMELVEGESPKGPMPFEDAWKIAMQIADALEYAHEGGVAHRDLKPANVKVTPDGAVKLLDFGLAKAFSGESTESANPENSPTLTMGATNLGVILGTAAYMAPEQAKGKRVDKRADIWSWSVVLYELLTGERLFEGEHAAETLAQILTKQPDLARVPVKVRRVLRRCLEKDPRERLRNIGVARELLEEPAGRPAPPSSKLAWGIAGAAVLTAILVAVGSRRSVQPMEHPLLRLSVDLGPDALGGARISPDGTRLVFRARPSDGRQLLAIRLLDEAQSVLLSGSEESVLPFFSPDGQWIGFFANGQMKKVSVRGGAVVPLCAAPNPRGAAWGEDGFIIASLNVSSSTGLSRVPEGGGTPEPLTKSGVAAETHRWPQILPGGQQVLFTASQAGFLGDARLEALNLKTGQIKVVQGGGYFGRYLPGGYLVYIRENTLFGVPFNLDRLEVRGTPTPLLDDVATSLITGGAQLDFSRNGTLVYVNGKSQVTSTISWLDSDGKIQPLLPTADASRDLRLSPDGKRLAFTLGGSEIQVSARGVRLVDRTARST